MSKVPCCLTGFEGWGDGGGEFLSLTIYSIIWCNLRHIKNIKHYSDYTMLQWQNIVTTTMLKQ